MATQAARVNHRLKQAAAVTLKHNTLLQIEIDCDTIIVILIEAHTSTLKHNLQAALLLTWRLQDALTTIGVSQLIT